MQETLVKLLPVAVASAVSPLLLTASIFVLASPKRPVAKAFMLAVGGLLVLVPVSIFIVFFDNQVAAIQAGPSGNGRDVLHMVAGVLLVVLILHDLKKRKTKKHQNLLTKSNELWKYVVGGFGLMLVNVTTLMMYVPAAAILNQSGLSDAGRLLGLAEMVAFSLLPYLIGPVLVILLGKRSGLVLKPLSHFMDRYGNDLIAVIFGILGVYLFIEGLLNFIK
ncbi:GAP family protein [Candidatus Saccharibacteria bacterium]|nr:GAP family protein [Candidatus Saccharibacteria bacterium]